MRYIPSFVHLFNTFTDWTLLSYERIKCTNSQLSVGDRVHLIFPPSWFSFTIIQLYWLYKTPSSNDTSSVYIHVYTNLSLFLFFFIVCIFTWIYVMYSFVYGFVDYLCSLTVSSYEQMIFFFFGLPLFKKSIIIC